EVKAGWPECSEGNPLSELDRGLAPLRAPDRRRPSIPGHDRDSISCGRYTRRTPRLSFKLLSSKMLRGCGRMDGQAPEYPGNIETISSPAKQLWRRRPSHTFEPGSHWRCLSVFRESKGVGFLPATALYLLVRSAEGDLGGASSPSRFRRSRLSFIVRIL